MLILYTLSGFQENKLVLPHSAGNFKVILTNQQSHYLGWPHIGAYKSQLYIMYILYVCDIHQCIYICVCNTKCSYKMYVYMSTYVCVYIWQNYVYQPQPTSP